MKAPGVLSGTDYRSGLLKASIAGLFLHFLAFMFFPQFEFTPYMPNEKAVIDLVEMEPVNVALEGPEEIVQPAISPPAFNDGMENETEGGALPGYSPNEALWPLPAVPAAVSGRTEYYSFDKCPVLIRSIRPSYPRLALLAGIEGDVLLKVLVGPGGNVLEASVIHSSVTKEMEMAALRAVMQFIFEPAVQGVMPVPASVAVPVSFRLY